MEALSPSTDSRKHCSSLDQGGREERGRECPRPPRNAHVDTQVRGAPQPPTNTAGKEVQSVFFGRFLGINLSGNNAKIHWLKWSEDQVSFHYLKSLLFWKAKAGRSQVVRAQSEVYPSAGPSLLGGELGFSFLSSWVPPTAGSHWLTSL